MRVHWLITGRRQIFKRAHQLDQVPSEAVACSQIVGINVCAETDSHSVLLIKDGSPSPPRITASNPDSLCSTSARTLRAAN